MVVCCASAGNMDASRFIGLVFLTLSLVLLSNQMQAANDTDPSTTGFMCPLMDFPNTVNGTLIHNIKRTAECLNGRKMTGCCVTRFYCDFNTSHIDLSLYGPPGFRISCSDICCPQNYILPIPLPNLSNTAKDDDDQDSSMDASDSIQDDSDSDENEQK